MLKGKNHPKTDHESTEVR